MTFRTFHALPIILAVMLSAVYGRAQQQEGKVTIWDGVYTPPQAERGQEIYRRVCAFCHLDDLSGAGGDPNAPALVGTAFLSRWRNTSVGEMLERVRNTMPQGSPGSLTVQEYTDLVSFMLKKNLVPAGDTELPASPGALAQVMVTEKSPGR